jgi:PAS domain S-box-containing protein
VSGKDNEEKGLKDVALQNARGILAARRRAEQELLDAKSALERKTSELAHSLSLMRAALDATADGILTTDRAGKVTGFNQQYLEMWRLPREVLDAREHEPILKIIERQFKDPIAYRARIREIYDTAPEESFDVLHLADGRVYERFSKVSIVDDQHVARVWSFRDVTEHVRAQEQLQKLNSLLGQRVEKQSDELRKSSQQFLQLVLGITDCAIYMLDPQGNITTWNPGAERIKGFSSEEILGKHFSIFYTEEDLARGLPHQALEIAAAKGKYEAESWRKRKDGSRFWASVLLDAIRDPDGKLLGFAKITRDLTEMRNMQEQLHQSQKMEAIGQLTGGVAHDFNNLLTVILGNLETLTRLLPPQEGRLRRAVDQAARGAQRAATLTQQLLAFSRRQPLNPKLADVNRLVTGMSDLIRRTLNENIAIETVLGAGVWRIEIDAHQLESALLNLAVNARDAMPEGGKLTIETANTHLDEAYTQSYVEVGPGQYVAICVSDTGTGMSKDVLARAFDPFFTTKPIGQGTGLGLSQVYGFVKQSGGHVRIYSEVGEGTTVKLYLPRAHGTELEAPREPAPLIPVGHSDEIILVVEDDEDVRSYSTDSLRELGFQVLEAHDGPSALRMLERHPEVMMLFTDVGLPGINGRELVDEATKRRPGLKVLFTSGYARNAIVHQGRLDAGVQLLTKPFTRAQLAARVRDVLDARPERSRSSKVALVVEDEPLVRLYLTQTIEQLGYEVLEAGSANQATATLATRQDICVVFIDVGLPDANGLDLASSVTTNYPHMRIVVTSGYGDPTEGAFPSNPKLNFLPKPYDADAVRHALQE